MVRGKPLAAQVVALPFRPHAYYRVSKEWTMSQIRYTKDHEWVRARGRRGVVGITDYAQSSSATWCLSSCRRSARRCKQGERPAVVESVKAASDVFAPVSGEVVAVNSEVEPTPALINEDALGKGWFFRIKLGDPAELDE